MEDDSCMPMASESMDEYLHSDRYIESSKVIFFSDFEQQEEANYNFWRHLTHTQRLELHAMMLRTIYPPTESENTTDQSMEIVFTQESS